MYAEKVSELNKMNIKEKKHNVINFNKTSYNKKNLRIHLNQS